MKPFFGAVVIAAGLSVAACEAPRDFAAYQETIGNFQAAIDQTSAVTFQYIRDINKFERDYEFERLRKDPDRPLDIPVKLMPGTVSSEALRARAEVFAVLKQYTDMLAQLAGSDASDRWKAATGRAKASADTLIKNLQENNAKLKDLPIAGMTGPLKAIADAIATEIINKKRSAALDTAILRAAPKIDEISSLLREDIGFVVRQRDSVNLLKLSELDIEYAKAQQAGDNSNRLRVLETIERALNAREADLSMLQALEQTLDRFDRAHDALLGYAQSEKGPQDLASLVSAVGRYAGLAKTVFDAYKAAAASS